MRSRSPYWGQTQAAEMPRRAARDDRANRPRPSSRGTTTAETYPRLAPPTQQQPTHRRRRSPSRDPVWAHPFRSHAYQPRRPTLPNCIHPAPAALPL